MYKNNRIRSIKQSAQLQKTEEYKKCKKISCYISREVRETFLAIAKKCARERIIQFEKQPIEIFVFDSPSKFIA